MKMRKKLAALLAAAMIASMMPMTAFAVSTNTVTKVVTVKKDSQIKKAVVPELKIDVKDALPTNQSFYLHLTGADWAEVDTQNTPATATDPIKINDEDLLGALEKFYPTAVSVKKDSTGSTKDSKIVYFIVNDGATPSKNFVFEAHREKSKSIAVRQLGEWDGNSANASTGAYGVKTSVVGVVGGHASAEIPFVGKLVFPMMAKVKDSEAFVTVDKYDTTISNNEFLFAVSDAAKVKVVVGDVTKFYRTGKIANIALEELYASSMAPSSVIDEERWFTLELRDTDFTFADIQDEAKIVGTRGYRRAPEQTLTSVDITGMKANYRLSADRTRLGVRLDNSLFAGAAAERGVLELQGVKIVADRDARDGEVVAVIDSKELFDKQTIVVAQRGEYKTKLDVPKDWKYEVVAGTEKEVKFTLSEELANSLVGQRPVTFTFDQGVKIKGDKDDSTKAWELITSDDVLWNNLSFNEAAYVKQLIKDIRDLEVQLAAAPAAKPAIEAKIIDKEYELNVYYYGRRPSADKEVAFAKGIKIEGSDVHADDKDEWKSTANLDRVHVSKDRDSFTVDEFKLDKTKAGKYTFTTTLLIPAGVTGDITVEATGKGITEDKIVLLKAEAPVTVEATTMDIKVGLKEIETTGKITIKETAKERLAQGKNIVLDIDEIDSGLKIKSFKATVVAGDLVLADRKITDLNVGIKRVSTEPSTIEITDIVMSTDRTVPEGKYNLLVGGNAISKITGRPEFAKKDHYMIDPVAIVKDFINITTKNTEDISASANKAEVKFVLGSEKYLVNGKEQTMDATAYAKEGRTMLPIRFVAQALGVNADQVIWDQANQTATIIADKTVQVKLGSKAMVINGVSVPMEAAAELTNDRTFVPVASIARALGIVVEWDQTTQTATFNPATK